MELFPWFYSQWIHYLCVVDSLFMCRKATYFCILLLCWIWLSGITVFFFFFPVLGIELRAYTLSHSTSPFFVMGFFKIRIWELFCRGWPQAMILLVSASCVARIIGMNHEHPVGSNSVLVDYLGCCKDRVISSANGDNLTSPFSICIPSISFSLALLLWLKFQVLYWTRVMTVDILISIPNFREISFSFSPVTTLLAMNLSCIAFIMLRYYPSIPSSSGILS
jgi:hypothetical protein